MADEEPSDELEKEIAELEKEIAALESGGPMDETPEPEAEPDAEDASGGGLRDKLPFGKRTKDDKEEPAEAADADQEPDDEASKGGIAGFMDRFRGDEDDEDAAGEDQPLESEPEQPAEEASPPEPEPAAEDPIEETEPPEPDDEPETTGIGGLMDRFKSGSEDEPEAEQPDQEPSDEDPLHNAEPEQPDDEALKTGPASPGRLEPDLTPRRREGHAEHWEKTEDGWLRLDISEVEQEEGPGGFLSRFRGRETPEPEPEPEPAEDDDEEDDISAAAALLARFGSSEPEPAAAAAPEPEEEEEDDERSKLLIAGWILGLLLLLALIAAAALWLLGDDAIGGGGADIAASVTSNALTNDEGAFIATVGSPITFDAGDTTGPVSEYQWAFGDGSTETTSEPTVSHTYTNRGPYTVSVLATDGDTTSEATLDVLAVTPPTPVPQVLFNGSAVAAPGEVGNNVFVGDSVTLNGEDSTADSASSLTTFEWDLDGSGGPEATGATAQASFDEAGRWLVNLTVVDDLGNEASQAQPVHVSDQVSFEDTAGTAVAGDSSNTHNLTVDAGRGGATPVQLSVTLTYDPGGQTGLPADTDSDLDLNVAGPNGTSVTATDDEATGQETLTVSGSDLANLGTWTITVTHDQAGSGLGAGNEPSYTVTAQIIY